MSSPLSNLRPPRLTNNRHHPQHNHPRLPCNRHNNHQEGRWDLEIQMVVVEAVEIQTTQTAMAAAEVTAKIQTVEEMTMSNKTHGQDVKRRPDDHGDEHGTVGSDYVYGSLPKKVEQDIEITWQPTIGELELWREHVERKVVSASALGRTRCRPWISQAFTARTEDELADPGTLFETVDDKLGVCMTELANSIIKKDPEPARRLAELNRRRRQLNQHATGLQMT